MAGPERESRDSEQRTPAEIKAELWSAQLQIEKAEANENPIERALQNDTLLERRDALEAELGDNSAVSTATEDDSPQDSPPAGAFQLRAGRGKLGNKGKRKASA